MKHCVLIGACVERGVVRFDNDDLRGIEVRFREVYHLFAVFAYGKSRHTDVVFVDCLNSRHDRVEIHMFHDKGFAHFVCDKLRDFDVDTGDFVAVVVLKRSKVDIRCDDKFVCAVGRAGFNAVAAKRRKLVFRGVKVLVHNRLDFRGFCVKNAVYGVKKFRIFLFDDESVLFA